MISNLETMMIREIFSGQTKVKSRYERGWIKNTSSRQFAKSSLQIAYCKLKIIFILVNHFSKIKHVIPFLILLFFASCEDRYWPELDDSYQNVIVVDGMITNGLPPYTVKLSLSSNVEVPQYNALSGYEVKILDDLGNIETLSEPEAGIYVTSPDGMQGVIGRSYQLTLHSPDGKTYQSDFEKLNNQVGIDSVYAQLEYHSDPDYYYDIEGYQFYINTETADTDSIYFFWSLTATYEYTSDLIIRWIYNGTLKPFTNFDSLRTCWKTEKVLDIFIYNPEELSVSYVHEFPLHYVSTQVRELSIRYSLYVEQLTISKAAYTFWHSIKEQNSEIGGLYSKLPYQIRGNLYNPDNPNELVLGYFMAAGVATKRIFVNRPPPPVQMRYPVCTLSEAEYMNFGTIFLTNPNEWPVYATYDNNGVNALPDNQDCMNCILKGGTIVKPEFWEDE